jgi:hypothetical protein
MAGLFDGNIIRSGLQGMSNAAASNLSFPVDAITWALNKAGANIQNPVMGSDWMRQQGLTANPENKLAGMFGEAAGMSAPFVAAQKAPQIAAQFLQGAENLAAPAVLNKQAGVVLGRFSPKLAARASQMDNVGASPGMILQETGLVKVPTSPTSFTWGKQVSDKEATINPDILARIQTGLDKLSKGNKQIPVENIQLKDVLNHPELYKAYPEIGNISVERVNGFQSIGGVEGFYNSASNILGIKPLNPYMTTPEQVSKQLTERVSVLIHEAQHAVQNIEKWPRGGSSSEFALQSTKTAGDQVNWATKSLEDAVKASFVSTGKAAPSNPLTVLDKVEALKTKGVDALKYLSNEQKEQVLFLASSPVSDSFLRTYSRIEKVATKVDARKLAAHNKYLSIAGEEQARAVQKAYEQGTSKVAVTAYYDREPANLLYRDPFTPTIK